MASIKFVVDERFEYLREHHTLGRRSDLVDTLLDYHFVSKLHAVIEWKNPQWTIKDLSTNGVWLNANRLKPNTEYNLCQGDAVQIAGTEGVCFEVFDLSKPQDVIYKVSQEQTHIKLMHNHLLPNNRNPELALYKCPDRGQWFSERICTNDDFQSDLGIDELEQPSSYEQGPYRHGDEILCDESQWKLFLVSEYKQTTEIQTNQLSLKDVEFQFNLSQDEETTSLQLICDDKTIDLFERSHHYLLVYLLRQKIEQSKLTSEQRRASNNSFGWVNCNLIMQELGIDETHMNIQIFRARKQITLAIPYIKGCSKLIQRRRGSVKIGIDEFKIFKENIPEA